jgi:hypothetical protein
MQERYITPELKEKEALILEAENNICELEYELFSELRSKVKEYIPRLQQLAKMMSELDVLQCFATISENRHYVKPEFSEDVVQVTDGRHPVVEKVMDSQSYVPNSCEMGKGRQMLLITGPNMSGKSTYMKTDGADAPFWRRSAVLFLPKKRCCRSLIRSLQESVLRMILYPGRARLWWKCLKPKKRSSMRGKTA